MRSETFISWLHDIVWPCFCLLITAFGIVMLFVLLFSDVGAKTYRESKANFYANCEAGNTYGMGREKATECVAYLTSKRTK